MATCILEKEAEKIGCNVHRWRIYPADVKRCVSSKMLLDGLDECMARNTAEAADVFLCLQSNLGELSWPIPERGRVR